MERKLTGKEEASLVATAPQRACRWTLKLLAGVKVKLAGPQTREPNRRTLIR